MPVSTTSPSSLSGQLRQDPAVLGAVEARGVGPNDLPHRAVAVLATQVDLVLAGAVELAVPVHVGAHVAVGAVHAALVVDVGGALVDLGARVLVEDVVAGGVSVGGLVPRLAALGRIAEAVLADPAEEQADATALEVAGRALLGGDGARDHVLVGVARHALGHGLVAPLVDAVAVVDHVARRAASRAVQVGAVVLAVARGVTVVAALGQVVVVGDVLDRLQVAVVDGRAHLGLWRRGQRLHLAGRTWRVVALGIDCGVRAVDPVPVLHARQEARGHVVPGVRRHDRVLDGLGLARMAHAAGLVDDPDVAGIDEAHVVGGQLLHLIGGQVLDVAERSIGQTVAADLPVVVRGQHVGAVLLERVPVAAVTGRAVPLFEAVVRLLDALVTAHAGVALAVPAGVLVARTPCEQQHREQQPHRPPTAISTVLRPTPLSPRPSVTVTTRSTISPSRASRSSLLL